MVTRINRHVNGRLFDAENAHRFAVHVSAISHAADAGNGYRHRIILPVPRRVGVEKHSDNLSRRD